VNDGTQPFELADLDLEVEPTRRQRRHSGGLFSHHGSVLFRGSGGDDSSANIVIHELSHYWLHASTPYGLVLDELAERQIADALRYCGTFNARGEKVPVPAHRAALLHSRGMLDLPPEVVRAIELWVKPWSHAVYLEHLLEGFDDAAVRSTPLPKALRWLAEYEERVLADAGNELFDVEVAPVTRYQTRLLNMWAEAYEEHEVAACALLHRGGGKAVPLGAQHLFEALAHSLENNDPTSDEFLVSEEGLPYMAAFASVLEAYGRERVDSTAAWETVAATFALLVDLALYLPVGRVYSRLRDDQMNWADLHPGYRFAQLVRCLRADDWVDGIDERAPRVQWELSRRLGWPRPDRFLELGASLNHVGLHSAHAAACKLRLDRTDRGIMWNGGDLPGMLEHHIDSYGPMQIIEDVRCFVPGDTPQTMLRYVMGYALHQLSWMTMASGDVSIEKLEPPMLSSSGVFDNVQVPDDFLELLLGAFPFLAQSWFDLVDPPMPASHGLPRWVPPVRRAMRYRHRPDM
jgi:hypothetical protein